MSGVESRHAAAIRGSAHYPYTAANAHSEYQPRRDGDGEARRPIDEHSAGVTSRLILRFFRRGSKWLAPSAETRNPDLMHELVTILAERNAVGHDQAQLRMRCKWLDMVRVQVAASVIPTVPACEAVADKHVEAPALVFRTESDSAPLGKFSVLVGVAGGTAECGEAHGPADLESLLGSTRYATSAAYPSALTSAHILARLKGMLLPLKGGGTPVGRSSNAYPTGGQAVRGKPVVTSVVNTELLDRMPRSTVAAPHLSGLNPRLVFLKGHSALLREDLHRADRCLSHAGIIPNTLIYRVSMHG